MTEHIDAWKNDEVFRKQLELNLWELSGNYPPHWKTIGMFLDDLKDAKSLLDVGCGCGAMSEVVKRKNPGIKYTGIDYAKEAINIAAGFWPGADFTVMDYQSLTPEFVSRFDIMLSVSLHNVLPDGDSAIRAMLSLGAKNIILGKILLTDSGSSVKTYAAYGEITTYEYRHNTGELLAAFEKYGYSHEQIMFGDSANFLLRRRSDV